MNEHADTVLCSLINGQHEQARAQFKRYQLKTAVFLEYLHSLDYDLVDAIKFLKLLKRK